MIVHPVVEPMEHYTALIVTDLIITLLPRCAEDCSLLLTCTVPFNNHHDDSQVWSISHITHNSYIYIYTFSLIILAYISHLINRIDYVHPSKICYINMKT